ncbi:TPA: ead/Ea22-like family protein [Escherichia coli]|nr:ead/Ea22-like family protein [Escherichia coli]
MSKIDYQALREVAEAAKGDMTWQNLQAFRAAATPEVVQALLDENERMCRDLIARNGEIEALRKWAEELEAREVALPVASCIVEDGEMCIDGFGEYVGHSLPDGRHELYAAPPAPVVPKAEPVAVNDDMAYAFHHALSDSSLGADEVEEIKAGLRAAFANVTIQPEPVVPDEIEPDDSNTFDYVDGWNACRAAMLHSAEPVARLTS